MHGESMTKESVLSFLNIPYHWGGKNPLTGLDCSGLTEQILAQIGMDPLGVQNAQALHDYYLDKSMVSTRGFGALCFYGPSVGEINHVAFMLNDYQIIEAGSGDHTTTSVERAQEQSAFVRVRLYNRRKDLVAILMPDYPAWVGAL